MAQHPYSNLPDSQFWSSGVKSAVSAHHTFSITPLLELFNSTDKLVSGGSCFAQYIGTELTNRGFNFLKSELSGERVESFGIGNIYSSTQWRQWLEFSLGYRHWGDHCEYEENESWYDLLLPHLGARSSKVELIEHRESVKNEILASLALADVVIFTVGLTETWRNSAGDVYPSCPGVLAGKFDNSRHRFHNCTHDEISDDLSAIESLLIKINSKLKLVYTVSPVALTATASESHVLVASSHSKSVIRAAVGEYCHRSERASYFPSYEIINHHLNSDWRLNGNLRSISEQGVRYVMDHAFAENSTLTRTTPELIPELVPDSVHTTTLNQTAEAVCEEELNESHDRLQASEPSTSSLVLVGDSHCGKFQSAFQTCGVDVAGGAIMNGSGFSDYKFELSNECVFLPLENDKSTDLWLALHSQILAHRGNCNIVTNIGFQTHKTILAMVNHFGTPVLTLQNIADYFEQFYQPQIYILTRLSRLGKIWLLEDPAFHLLVSSESNSYMARAKTFQQYCNYMRVLAQEFGMEYIDPCDAAIQRAMQDGATIGEMIHSDGLHGTEKYYKYCASVISDIISEYTQQTAAMIAA